MMPRRPGGFDTFDSQGSGFLLQKHSAFRYYRASAGNAARQRPRRTVLPSARFDSSIAED